MRSHGPVSTDHKAIIDYHDAFGLSKRRAERTAGRSHGKTRLGLRAKSGHIAHRFQESVLPCLHDPPGKFKHLCYSMFSHTLSAANSCAAKFLGGSLNNSSSSSSSSSNSLISEIVPPGPPNSQEIVDAVINLSTSQFVSTLDMREEPLSSQHVWNMCLPIVLE